MQRHTLRPRLQAGRGFTLIELLIAVVVIGVLAAVALPSFMGSIRKSRRAEAVSALAAVQSAQERWRANQPAYSSRLTNAPTDTPPGLGLPAVTASGYYAISLSDASANGYTALATAVSGTSQTGDANCGQMQVRMAGGNIFYGSGPAGGSVAESAAASSCWSR